MVRLLLDIMHDVTETPCACECSRLTETSQIQRCSGGVPCNAELQAGKVPVMKRILEEFILRVKV